MIVVFAAQGDPELEQQALTFAGALDDELERVTVNGAYAPAVWAQALVSHVSHRDPSLVIAAGHDRGNEVLAHMAALLDQPLAANCTALTPGDPVQVTRVRWGGSLLEEALLH